MFTAFNKTIGKVQTNFSSKSEFKSKHSFEERSSESGRIRTKYPDRIPIIVERGQTCKLDIDKKKYLVPHDLTMGQLIFVIRKRMKLAPEHALFLYVNGILPPTSALVSFIYDQHKSDDGFLYVNYTEENTFGSN
jgi:GABA(A) receptor-associated protein